MNSVDELALLRRRELRPVARQDELRQGLEVHRLVGDLLDAVALLLGGQGCCPAGSAAPGWRGRRPPAAGSGRAAAPRPASSEREGERRPARYCTVAFFEVVFVDLVIVQVVFLVRAGRSRDRVVEELPAPLHVGVAHEGVVVERRLLGVGDLVEEARALVDDVDRAGADRRRTEPARSRCRTPARQSPARPTVSRGLDGPKNGSTRYGPGEMPQTPNVCPVSSICSGRPRSVGEVEEAEPAEERVDLEARQRFRCGRAACLAGGRSTNTIGKSRLLKKRESARCDRIRHDVVPAARHRLEGVDVELVVEPEGLAVERLPTGRSRAAAVGGRRSRTAGRRRAGRCARTRMRAGIGSPFRIGGVTARTYCACVAAVRGAHRRCRCRRRRWRCG